MTVSYEQKELFLVNYHKQHAAKQIQFSQWEVPAFYSSIIDEHNCVRQKAGLFDISHMGEFHISGRGAYAFLQKVLSNNLDRYPFGKAFYSVMCLDSGGVVDDVFVYPVSKEKYLMVVNAANIEKDFAWLKKFQTTDVVLENYSSQHGLLALQGPLAEQILRSVFSSFSVSLSFHEFSFYRFMGQEVVISATGYTGEKGFEVMYPKELATEIWDLFLEKGKTFGLQPIGFGARDTLRLEAGCALYGHELSDSITPFEAGLGWIVRFDKEFIGKEALVDLNNQDDQRTLVGLFMIDRSVPREGYEVYLKDKKIGLITSGSYLPFLKENAALALVEKNQVSIDDEVKIKIRERFYKAKIVKTPFYRIPK